jgi:hypothetical protein
MKSEKRKLILAVACLAIVVLASQLIALIFPNLTRTSPQLSVAFFVILFVPMVVSMFYLMGTLTRFIVQKLVDYEEKQKARHLPLKQCIARKLLAWFVLACSFGILAGSFNLPTFWALSKRGVSTQGQVLKTEKEVLIHYKFRVGQRVYTHSSLAPSPQKLNPGARVPVLYDPQNPQVSILGPVKPRLNNELMFVGMVVTVFPAMLMFMFKRALLPGWKRTLTKR